MWFEEQTDQTTQTPLERWQRWCFSGLPPEQSATLDFESHWHDESEVAAKGPPDKPNAPRASSEHPAAAQSDKTMVYALLTVITILLIMILAVAAVRISLPCLRREWCTSDKSD
jgi:hypothetical protein